MHFRSYYLKSGKEPLPLHNPLELTSGQGAKHSSAKTNIEALALRQTKQLLITKADMKRSNTDYICNS